MSSTNSQKGFIALISVIVLGFVLLITVLALGSRSLGTRFLLLDLERKNMSKSFAEGCVQVAIIKIVNDPKIVATPTTLEEWEYPKVGSSHCYIYSVTPDNPTAPTQSTIKTTASSTNATTNLEVIWDISGERITSWKEVANF